MSWQVSFDIVKYTTCSKCKGQEEAFQDLEDREDVNNVLGGGKYEGLPLFSSFLE